MQSAQNIKHVKRKHALKSDESKDDLFLEQCFQENIAATREQQSCSLGHQQQTCNLKVKDNQLYLHNVFRLKKCSCISFSL